MVIARPSVVLLVSSLDSIPMARGLSGHALTTLAKAVEKAVQLLLKHGIGHRVDVLVETILDQINSPFTGWLRNRADL